MIAFKCQKSRIYDQSKSIMERNDSSDCCFAEDPSALAIILPLLKSSPAALNRLLPLKNRGCGFKPKLLKMKMYD